MQINLIGIDEFSTQQIINVIHAKTTFNIQRTIILSSYGRDHVKCAFLMKFSLSFQCGKLEQFFFSSSVWIYGSFCYDQMVTRSIQTEYGSIQLDRLKLNRIRAVIRSNFPFTSYEWIIEYLLICFFSYLRMHFASQLISIYFQYLYIVSASALRFGACYVGYFALSNYMISWNTMHTVAAIADWISIPSYIRPTMLHYDQCNEIIKTIIFFLSVCLSFSLTFASFFFSLNRLWEKSGFFLRYFLPFSWELAFNMAEHTFSKWYLYITRRK